jgi:hypothetical protein
MGAEYTGCTAMSSRWFRTVVGFQWGMSTADQRAAAQQLFDLITRSTQSEAWLTSSPVGSALEWQHDAVSRLLALTYNQPIEYLSVATPENGDWDIVAFTDSIVVSLTLIRTSTGVSHLDSLAFPRRSLESLELLDITSISDDDETWPDELNLIGHYKNATLRLPLDKFASQHNKSDLAALLSSLLHDLAH